MVLRASEVASGCRRQGISHSWTLRLDLFVKAVQPLTRYGLRSSTCETFGSKGVVRRSRFLSSSLAPFALPPLPSNTESSEEELGKTCVGVCLSVVSVARVLG